MDVEEPESINNKRISIRNGGGVDWKDRPKALKTLKTLKILALPSAVIIPYFAYKVFVSFGVPHIEWAVLIFTFFSLFLLGIFALGYRNLSIIEQAIETADMQDFFSTKGRKKVMLEPNNYFNPGDFKKYLSNLKYLQAYKFIMAAIGLLLIMLLFK